MSLKISLHFLTMICTSTVSPERVLSGSSRSFQVSAGVSDSDVFVLRSGENMMPTELELNRVINNIQELLYSASDVSHDRCVKVLTARAKVRDQRSPRVSDDIIIDWSSL